MAHISEYEVENLFIDRLESIGYEFVALRDYHEKPDLIIIPGFANPHEIATDRRTGDAKAWLFTADPADALAIRDWLVASHREGVEIAAMCTGVFAPAWNAPRTCRSSTIWPRSFPRRWCRRTVC